MAKPKVIVILGPTASGKSDLAVRLAREFNGEIISADSRQVYKGLDIGTGKITKKEMKGVPHHLLNVANPKERFSASEYKTLAEKTLKNILERGKLPLVAGGTGFYIDTITCAMNFPEVPPNPALRKKLSAKSAEMLFKVLKKKDPVRAKTVDPYNKLRLIRALEIVEALGKVPRIQRAQSPDYDFIFIGLKPEDLEERIRARLIKRMPAMIREAKKLKQNGLSYKRMHELGLEYRFLARYLQKEISREEMESGLNTAIRQYARRQMVWFKRNKDIKWFNPEEYKAIAAHVRERL